MRTGLIVVAVGVVLAGIGLGVLLVDDPSARPAVQLSPRDQPPTEPVKVVTQAPPAEHPAPAPVSPAPPSLDLPSMMAKVKALAASDKPADAFKAAKMLQACRTMWAWTEATPMKRRGDLSAWETEELKSGRLQARKDSYCGDLDVAYINAQIVPLLERAAAAAVPQAADDLESEGPFGRGMDDLELNPDDIRINEWKARMVAVLKSAADRGDYVAMLHLAQNYGAGDGFLQEQNSYLELKYWAAGIATHNQAVPDRPINQSGIIVKRLAAKMSPEQAKAAIAEGLALAAKTAPK